MEKELRLYKYVDGIADTPFPSLEEQAVLRTFTYSAKRMGGAPSIAGTIMHESCLDSLWSNKVYATFNGEKYFVRRTPSSSHSNTDSRYRHDVELISERASLDEVYFFDVVTVDSESDKPQSNNSNVVFFGDIFEFVSRLNKSLTRSGLGYNVQVDAGVTSEAKLVTLKDQFVTNALQEIPKLYNLKYYFDGKTIHVGDSSLDLVDTFQYGSTSALLSINKNNSNSRIVNRCSGLGGSKNIPYFYPNKSPYGDVAILLNGSSTDRATVFSWERFAKCGLSKTIVYKEVVQGGTVITTYNRRENVTHTITHGENDRFEDIFTKWEVIPIKVSVYKGTLSGRFTKIKAVKDSNNEHSIAIRQNGSDFYTFSSVGTNPWSVDLDYGDYELVLKIPYDYGKWNSFDEATEFEATLTETIENVRGWFVDGNEMVGDLSSLGITFIGTPANGDTISFELKHDRIPVSANLMPYIYRESMGEERFYNAVDGEIKVGDEVIGDYKFSNPYFEGDPREHIESFDDIYPTIEGITNASGQRVDEFVEFAYDENDSDERDENNNLAHPYFYAKLRKFDGENGFNLFTHAIESEAMSLSVKDGACGGCDWKIQVDENTNLNPVQVWEYDQYDENGVLQRKGTLKRDANGNVLRGAPQEVQNDTTINEVWVALRKDESTFGVPMPNAKNNYKPSIGDKFVILNISLPQSYIEFAEKKLSKAVVDYMGKNNSERFNFGIKFSRIYLEENKDNILQKLSENIRLRVSYDDRVIPLYASGFTYKMDASSPLPEVTIELEDNVSVLNDRLSVIVRPLYMQAIENAQKEVVSKVLSEPSFASTIKPNIFANDATFNKNVRMDGVVSSSDYIEGLLGGQGWGIYKSLDGNTVFEVDEVVARRGFKTVEFVVNETKAQKGEYLITLGNCKVSHVDEYDTYYRCYYDNHGNTDVSGFAVNDQAICRVYDESYANVNKYYWRLVVGVGFDYVDLSKLDFDGDGIPTQNDVLVQLGNRDDVARQNAITITSAPTPSIIQYKGISGYSITQDNVVTKLSPDENILTGKVVMQSGSKGLENFEEWAEKQAQIDGFEYLREAMANDTTIEGGLIQSSLLRLGYKQNGEFVAMSGTSGLYDSDDAHGGIAAWYGGDMVDAENNPNSSRAAQALFRMDGTGYLAGGKITWDKTGAGSVAGGSLKWDKDGYITLANEIYLGDDEEETLGSILNKVSGIGSSLSDMFTVVESNGAKYIRANYDFFSVGGVTAGGIGSSSGGGSGGGGSSTLSGLNDVALKNLAKDNMLAYNGTHWVNIDMATIKPDLTAYATKTWVEGKGYALNTALLKVDARLANVETIFTADQDGAINKWSEVVAFLDGIEGDTLDSILSQFATIKWVENKKYITAYALEPYALKTAIPTKNSELENDAEYITSAALNGYATQSWVSEQGYLVSSSLDGYATQNWVEDKKYLDGIDSTMVITALGYTPYNAGNFTKANIKSTLGISDWALASAKPTYQYSEIQGIPDLSVYFLKASFTGDNIKTTLGISEWALAASKPSYKWSEINERPVKLSQFTDDVVSGNYLPIDGTAKNAGKLGNQAPTYYATASALSTLSTAVTEFRTLFNSLFEKDTANNAIKAKLSLYSVGGITSGGIGSGGSSGGGGASYNRLDAWADYTNDKSGWVLSALLGKDLDTRVSALANAGYITVSALDPYAKSADVANTYATKTALQGVDIRVQAIEYIFEEDQDGVINKWSEIVNFLAGVEGTTLDSILEQFATKDSLAGYLPRSGGYVTGVLTMFRSSSDGYKTNAICFDDQHWRSYLYQDTDVLYWGHYNDPSKDYILLNSSNYSNYTYSKAQMDTALGNKLGTNDNAVALKCSTNIGTNFESITPEQIYALYPTEGAVIKKGVYHNAGNGVVNTDIAEVSSFSLAGTTLIQAGSYGGYFTQLYLTPDVMLEGKSRNEILMYSYIGDKTAWTRVLTNRNYTNYTVPKTGGTFSGSVKVIKDFGGNLSDFATNQHYGAFEVGRASNNMCLAIGVTDDDYGYIQSKGQRVTNQGKLVLNPMGGSLYYSAELKPIFHEGNYTNYVYSKDQVVPKNGGEFTNAITISKDTSSGGRQLILNGTNAEQVNWNAIISFRRANNELAYIGTSAGNEGLGSLNFVVAGVTSMNLNEKGLTVNSNVTAPTFVGNLTGNADSATKLATPRTLWGQSFDGTGNVSGIISNVNGITFSTNGCINHDIYGNLYWSTIPGGARWYISKSVKSDKVANSNETLLSVDPINSRVGVNIYTPTEALDVAGNIKTSGSVRIGDAILSWDSTNKCVTIKNANTGEKASLFVDGGITGTKIN